MLGLHLPITQKSLLSFLSAGDGMIRSIPGTVSGLPWELEFELELACAEHQICMNAHMHIQGAMWLRR